jgi:hypothetical protein
MIDDPAPPCDKSRYTRNAGSSAEDVTIDERKEAIMSVSRKKMSKAEEDQLFTKASEALRLFSEKPEVLRGFLESIKTGNFSQARGSLNASLDRRREEGGAAAGPSRVPSDDVEK